MTNHVDSTTVKADKETAEALQVFLNTKGIPMEKGDRSLGFTGEAVVVEFVIHYSVELTAGLLSEFVKTRFKDGFEVKKLVAIIGGSLERFHKPSS